MVFVFSCASVAEEQGKILRDPTTPLNYQPKVAAEMPLQLQAIIIREGNKLAIVNGQSHKEGDRIHGQRIVKINDQHLVLASPDGQKILALRPSIHHK